MYIEGSPGTRGRGRTYSRSTSGTEVGKHVARIFSVIETLRPSQIGLEAQDWRVLSQGNATPKCPQDHEILQGPRSKELRRQMSPQGH